MIRHLFFALIVAACSLHAYSQSTEKQLRDSLSFTRDDKSKLRLLFRLIKEIGIHSPDSALQLGLSAVVIAKRSESEKGMASAYRAVGKILYSQGKYPSAIENFKTAFLHSQKVNDSLSLSNELDDIGRGYRRLGDPQKALQYFQQGLGIATAVKNKDMIGGIYNNMALVLNDNGEDSLALQYYQKSLDIAVETKDTASIILSLNNIGGQYYRLKDLKKEEECYLRALELSEKSKGVQSYGLTYDNIGSMWEDRGDLQRAFVFFSKALEYERKSGVKVYIAEELRSLSAICIKMKNYQMALGYAQEELSLSNEVQSAELKRDASKNMSIAFEKLRQFEPSLRYLKIANEINDSLNSVARAKAVSNLASRYELTKKESELKSLNVETENQKLQLLQANRIKYGLIFFLAVVSALLIIAVYQYRGRKKANELLTIWGQAVDQKNRELNNLNKVKDKIFSSIAHDVRSPLSSIQGLLSLINMNVLSPAELQKIIVELSARVNTTTSLLENLLHWSKNQIANAVANPVKTNVNALVCECMDLYRNNAVEKNIKLVNDISEEFCIYADEEMVKIVLRNLISNAIKFTRRDGEVKVIASTLGSTLAVSISDTGIGIPPEDLAKIFTLQIQSTHGTAKEKGTGLGLILCKEFIEKNGGNISVNSTYGEGSTFTFTAPVA